MANVKAARLTGRAVIGVSGADAPTFLQDLVTSDIAGLDDGAARNAALLTPQGKILFEFIVVHATGARFLIECPADSVDELVKRLTFYKLRAKVDLAPLPDLDVLALWADTGDADTTAPDFEGVYTDPRLPALGWRAIVPEACSAGILGKFEAADEAAYEAHRIGLGVAELGKDYQSGAVFPHEADLDQLGGVDFSKGCYVGQEVVSRMQHRGTARSRFVPVTLDGTAGVGTPVEAGGKQVGTMGSSASGRGIALLRLDRVAKAVEAGDRVTSGAATLVPVKPGWATFDWPAGETTDAE